jgi:uncharacterized membrane protein YdbT with pleckstrin-like domain
MAEKPLWTGTASQLKNLGAFLLCVFILPIPWALWKWLTVKCRVFELTSERLLITSGILSKTTESLELYRIRDLQVTQPFFQRLFGLQTLHLITSDATTPEVVLDHLPAEAGLAALFREHIESCRMAKRVREIDIE